MLRTFLISLLGLGLGLAGCGGRTLQVATGTIPGEAIEWRWGDPRCRVELRAAGQLTVYWRDEEGRLVRAERDGSLLYRRGFDRQGRLAVEERKDEVRRYRYDDAGRLAGVTLDDGKRTRQITYLRDGAGHQLEETIEQAPPYPMTRTKWTRDDHGRLIEMWMGTTDEIHQHWLWARDALGRVVIARGRSTTDGVPSWSVTRFTYAGDTERVTGAHDEVEGHPGFTSDTTYRYDSAGRVVAVIRRARDNGAVFRTELDYDAAGASEMRSIDTAGRVEWRSHYERSPGRVVHIADSNADGTPDAEQSIVDHCPGGASGETIVDYDTYFTPNVRPSGLPREPD
jgi:YD repeat-containing protein